MATKQRAFLLRLQRSEGSNSWRASLQDAYTGEVVRFGNEREMLRYLLRILSAPNPTAGESDADDMDLREHIKPEGPRDATP